MLLHGPTPLHMLPLVTTHDATVVVVLVVLVVTEVVDVVLVLLVRITNSVVVLTVVVCVLVCELVAVVVAVEVIVVCGKQYCSEWKSDGWCNPSSHGAHSCSDVALSMLSKYVSTPQCEIE